MEHAAAAHLDRGRDAEQAVYRYLKRSGLTLLDRNFRSRYGEIDLIMQHGETVVFVEVRYRRSAVFGSPAETVTRRKQAKLRATAETYLRDRVTASTPPCRFDIVAVTGHHDGENIDWIQNAF